MKVGCNNNDLSETRVLIWIKASGQAEGLKYIASVFCQVISASRAEIRWQGMSLQKAVAAVDAALRACQISSLLLRCVVDALLYGI